MGVLLNLNIPVLFYTNGHTHSQAAPTASPSIKSWKFSSTIEDKGEKAMAPYSSTLAWKIPWAEEPGRLQSIMESRRVGHD